MRTTEPLRLAAMGVLMLLVQLAIYLRFPEWRAGMDFYLVFLLLLTATRGQLIAGSFALAGGIVMDAFSGSLYMFHTVFYLAPVLLGSLMRSYVLVEYRPLAALCIAGLLLLKVVAMFGVAFTLDYLHSPLYLLKVNYWSILLAVCLVYFSWSHVVHLFANVYEVKGFGR